MDIFRDMVRWVGHILISGISSTSSNRKVDSIVTYVDSVSIIMATCPHTLLQY